MKLVLLLSVIFALAFSLFTSCAHSVAEGGNATVIIGGQQQDEVDPNVAQPATPAQSLIEDAAPGRTWLHLLLLILGIPLSIIGVITLYVIFRDPAGLRKRSRHFYAAKLY